MIGCAAGWPSIMVPGGIDLHRGSLVVAWLASIAAGVVVARSLRTRRTTLVERTGWHLAWVGLIATVMTGLPIVLVPACL